MKRVVLFGSLVAPDVVGEMQDASEAANRFQFGLVGGLRELGIEVAAASLQPVASRPLFQKMVVRGRRWDVAGMQIVAPGFVNLPLVKVFHAGLVFRATGRRLARGADAVLAYNPLPGVASAGLAVARRAGVPFVCIAADHGTVASARWSPRGIERSWMSRLLRRSDGLVVLSRHNAVDLAPGVPWVKVDGGVMDDWVALEPVPVKPKTILYAGTPAVVSGTRLLLQAFARIADPDMRLVFVGRGGIEAEVEAACRQDPRISRVGFVSRREMQELLRTATVLVNPRLSAEPENRYNFPSKMLDYLASGRPVVTTLAGDLDPAYREVAVPLTEETPVALAACLEELCQRNPEDLAAIGGRGRDWVLAERRWRDQAAVVASFLEGLEAARA